MYCKVLILFGVFVYCNADGLQYQSYQYQRSVDGWIKAHKLAATWKDAYNKCLAEGAELAAPVTPEMANEMKFLIGNNNHSAAYFIDAKARYVPGIFVSAKGVPLSQMPVSDMIESLDQADGECIGMNSHQIRVVPCSKEMPYICFRKQRGTEAMNECGTYDFEYKHNEATDSCYKLHKTPVTWHQAYATCIDEGGYLVVINNETEARAVWELYHWHTSPFIGLEAQEGNAVWKSILGDPVETIYNVWRTCSDCKSKTDTTYRCALLNEAGQLYPWPCQDNTRHFLCEKDPQQEAFYTFEK